MIFYYFVVVFYLFLPSFLFFFCFFFFRKERYPSDPCLLSWKRGCGERISEKRGRYESHESTRVGLL